jgi:hypothetical protein
MSSYTRLRDPARPVVINCPAISHRAMATRHRDRARGCVIGGHQRPEVVGSSSNLSSITPPRRPQQYVLLRMAQCVAMWVISLLRVRRRPAPLLLHLRTSAARTTRWRHQVNHVVRAGGERGEAAGGRAALPRRMARLASSPLSHCRIASGSRGDSAATPCNCGPQPGAAAASGCGHRSWVRPARARRGGRVPARTRLLP